MLLHPSMYIPPIAPELMSRAQTLIEESLREAYAKGDSRVSYFACVAKTPDKNSPQHQAELELLLAIRSVLITSGYTYEMDHDARYHEDYARIFICVDLLVNEKK